ncbi:MAG: hypothetical protein AABW81_03520 [Nanoarchaeota archaeon]
MVGQNKRGWIKIAEMSISFIIIATVLFTIVRYDNTGKEDISISILEKESIILKEIKENPEAREEILNVNTLPVDWENFSNQDLDYIKSSIIIKTPTYLDCEGKVCYLNDSCQIDRERHKKHKNIYTESVVISSDINKYNPRQLKLFCWER